MLDAVRNDNELAGVNDDFSFGAGLAHRHLQRAFDHEEKFVFDIVMMPDELALQLHKLYVEVVQLADDLGAVVVGEERELLGEVHFVHVGHRKTQRARLLAPL